MTEDAVRSSACVDDSRSGSALPSVLYANERGDASPFRIVVVAPATVPAWLRRFAEAARACRWIDLLVVTASESEREHPNAPAADVRAYLAVDRVRHRRARHRNPLAPIPLEALCDDHPQPVRDDGQALAQVASRVGTLQADLVLLAGAASWGAALAAQARHGCWCLDASLTDPYYGGLPLLSPILQAETATLVGLELLDDEGRTVALADSWGATQSSFNLQRERAMAKIPALLLRSLRQLALRRIDLPPGQAQVLRLVSTPAPSRLAAGARATAISVQAAARWQIKKRRHGETWALLLRHADKPIDPAAPELAINSVLAAPRQDYWADPCVVESDGRRLIFVEEYGARRATGVIACLELLADGSARRLGIAMDEPFHLSYPQAFPWEGQWYMTVESAAARRVSLYRATGFPLRWEREADLISGCVCVDGTLHYQDGRWYLFVNISESGGSSCDELFLFVSDQLTGPYLPHPANPVVTDVRRARPAGRIFRRGGRLVRPSQDCGPDYGAALVFNEILTLSPTQYAERPLARLEPAHEKGMNGCHTYSCTGSVEVLDGHGRLSDAMRRIPVSDASVPLDTPAGSAPLLSVIVFARGRRRSVAGTIESLLAQSCRDLEIIVLDDGAQPLPIEAADRYACDHPGRVRFVPPLGEHARLSPLDGLAAARGRYVAFVGADENWLPDHALACLTLLERDSGLGFVYAQTPGTGRAGDPLSDDVLPYWDSRPGVMDLSAEPGRQDIRNAIFRRSVAQSCGAIDGLDRLFEAPAATMRRLFSWLSEAADVACADALQPSARPILKIPATAYGLGEPAALLDSSTRRATEATTGLAIERVGASAAAEPDRWSAAPEEYPGDVAGSLSRRCLEIARRVAAVFRLAPQATPDLVARIPDTSGRTAQRRGASGLAAVKKIPVVGVGVHYLRYSTANLLVLAAGFISFPILTRLLDNAQYGILGYYEAWVAVAVAVAKLGTQHSLVRFYPFQGTAEKLEHFVTNLVALPVVISLSLWLLVAAALGAYGVVSGSGFSAVFWCAFVSVPLLVLASVIEMILRASERSLLLTVMRVVKRWLELLLVLGAVIALQHTALAVYWGRLAAAALVLAYCLHWAWRNLSISTKALDLPAMFDSWRYGLPLVANEIAFIVLISIDRVMLKQMTGDFAAVGIYTVGYSLAMQINVLMQASLYEAFVPVANRVHDVEGDAGVRALKDRLLMPMTYASIGIAALVLGVGNEAMVALSGPSKVASGPVFVAIGMTFALYPLIDIAGYGLLLHKRSMLVLGTTVTAATLNIVLNLLLIPAYGVMGAVAATTASYVLLGGIKCALCPPELRRFPDLRTVLLAIACAAGFLAVVKFGNVLGVVSTWPRLFVAGLLFLALYALPVWSLDPKVRGLVASKREPGFA